MESLNKIAYLSKVKAAVLSRDHTYIINSHSQVSSPIVPFFLVPGPLMGCSTLWQYVTCIRLT